MFSSIFDVNRKKLVFVYICVYTRVFSSGVTGELVDQNTSKIITLGRETFFDSFPWNNF